MYRPLRPARHETVKVRTLDYHLHLWGEPRADRPPLVLLHGWMDVGASWQFVVDALRDDRFVVAPDWRGFGRTRGGGVDNYWLPDYMADLDFLLDRFDQGGPVDIVGHSLGGNVLMHFAGARPGRVRRAVNLEGFGMAARQPDEAPGRYARWMDELKQLHRGELDLVSYPSAEGVAQRLMKNNPRLDADKAAWLAREWAAPFTREDGSERWAIRGDAAHKVINANLFRAEETVALYAAVTAPVLVVVASEGHLRAPRKDGFTLDDFKRRFAAVRDGRFAEVPEAGHMLHHDQPARVASLIEGFLA